MYIFWHLDQLLHNQWLHSFFPSPLSLCRSLTFLSLSSSSLRSFVCLCRLPLFSSSAAMRKQLCTKDNYITVCMRVCGNTGRMVRETKRRLRGGKNMKKTFNFSLDLFILMYCVCWCFLPPPPILSSISTDRVTGLWNVKNCSMHGNSLSCQTSHAGPASSHEERQRERKWVRESETWRKPSSCYGHCSRSGKGNSRHCTWEAAQPDECVITVIINI